MRRGLTSRDGVRLDQTVGEDGQELERLGQYELAARRSIRAVASIGGEYARHLSDHVLLDGLGHRGGGGAHRLLGHVVDERVEVAAREHLPIGDAHAQAEVVHANASLAVEGRVEDGELHEHFGVLVELVVVLELDAERGGALHAGELDVVVAREREVADRVDGAHARARAHLHDHVEGARGVDRVAEVVAQALAAGGRVGAEEVVLVDEAARLGVQIGERGHVAVLIGHEEEVDAAAVLDALLGQLGVVVGGGREHLLLALGAEQLLVVAVLELTGRVRRIGQVRVEDEQLALALGRAQRLDARLDHGAVHALGLLVRLEHGRQRVEERMDDAERLVDAHQEAVENGHEDLLEVAHDHHLRSGEAALQVVEVELFVVGDEADARLGGEQLGQYVLLEVGTEDAQEAVAHAVGRHVDHEDEGGRTGQRGLAAIVLVGDELVGAVAELGPIVHVDSAAHVVEVVEVLAGHERVVLAERTLELLAVLDEHHKRRHVRLAALAAHRADLAQVAQWRLYLLTHTHTSFNFSCNTNLKKQRCLPRWP